MIKPIYTKKFLKILLRSIVKMSAPKLVLYSHLEEN